MARGSLHALTAADPLQKLRLSFKRAFTSYYLDLRAPDIADPSEAFAHCYHYLLALAERLGSAEFMRRLDDETTNLAGEVEQDLRHRVRTWDDVRGESAGGSSGDDLGFDDLEDRLRECFEYARNRLVEEERLWGEQA